MMESNIIAESPSHTLAQICRLNRGLMHNLVGGIGLHQGQPHVLELLWQEDGRTQTDLVGQLHVSAATISNTIKRMEKTGFVERRADPADERVSRVYLTETGREIQYSVRRLWQAFETHALAGFSAEEAGLLQDFLTRLYSNLLDIDCVALLACVRDS